MLVGHVSDDCRGMLVHNVTPHWLDILSGSCPRMRVFLQGGQGVVLCSALDNRWGFRVFLSLFI